MHKQDLAFNVEKILDFDEIVVGIDTIQQDGEMFFSLEINDHSFLYTSKAERDQDHTDIVNLITSKIAEVDNDISTQLLYSAMMAINKAPNTKMHAFKDTYDVGTHIKEHLIKIGFLDATKVKNFKF